ncbi:MAG: phenylalanine--tRNA ligase subunit beta [Pseudomonadales bacterium]
MKISERWLREWVDTPLSAESLAEQLTMAGLEVEARHAVGIGLDGVVIGQILSAEQHPNADKLRVCQVSDGSSILQVVCGAPNARADIKVPFATVGAVLPGGMEIKTAKLRDVESQGMLCAQAELELGEASDGLWELPQDAALGQPLADYFDLPDNVFDIDLTPNRSDCLGLAGVAREVGVLNKLSVSHPAIAPVAAKIDDTFPVSLQAAAECPRYVGRVIRNVDLSRAAPLWLQERLRRAGMRSIDAAVDVTNYVMLELGQPMHAFDLDQLDQGIVVRKAKNKEELTLLDEQSLTLDENCLLIADHSKPLALAGIMGGADSGVSTTTQHLFLEAAFFSPTPIAGRARAYGLHTDASHRFERGVDWQLQHLAMERATQLLLDIVGGEAGPLSEAASEEHLPSAKPITLRRSRIGKILGFELDDAEVEDILQRLGSTVEVTPDGWCVVAPSFRFDLAIEADLLEELARIYGYNNLPSRNLLVPQKFRRSAESLLPSASVKRQLLGRGYQEAVTYSFIDPVMQAQFDPAVKPVVLANPISSEMSVMRTSLLPGLVQALAYNVARQQQRVRLFETGQRFIKSNEDLLQDKMLAGVACGERWDKEWANEKAELDFFDVKGDVESLLSLTGRRQDYRFEAAEHPALHPGQTAALHLNGKEVGIMGALHPRLVSENDLSAEIYLFEISLQALLQGILPSYGKISKFPEVQRDLAILIDKDVESSVISGDVREIAGEQLTDMTIFDVYDGQGIAEGKKSLGLGLTLQDHSRTLTEQEVSKCLDKVVASLEQKFGATLRN